MSEIIIDEKSEEEMVVLTVPKGWKFALIKLAFFLSILGILIGSGAAIGYRCGYQAGFGHQ